MFAWLRAQNEQGTTEASGLKWTTEVQRWKDNEVIAAIDGGGGRRKMREEEREVKN